MSIKASGGMHGSWLETSSLSLVLGTGCVYLAAARAVNPPPCAIRPVYRSEQHLDASVEQLCNL